MTSKPQAFRATETSLPLAYRQAEQTARDLGYYVDGRGESWKLTNVRTGDHAGFECVLWVVPMVVPVGRLLRVLAGAR